jgi:hypothetical protein
MLGKFPQAYSSRCSENLASHFGTEILEIGHGFEAAESRFLTRLGAGFGMTS